MWPRAATFLTGFAIVAVGTLGCRARSERYPTDGRLELPAELRVAHALGGVDRVTYTNSREAFEGAYARGWRWFEVDLAFTRDGDLVCFHKCHERHLDLPRPIHETSTEEFLSRRYKGRFTTLTFRQLLQQLRVRPDAVLVTDTKEWSAAMLRRIEREVVEVAPSLRKRIVVQIYRPEDLSLLLSSERRNGLFGGIIFTLYQTSMSDEEVVSFVRECGLDWVAVSRRRFNPELVRTLNEVGARVLVHTVNRPDQLGDLASQGATGFYTDFLAPKS